MPAPAQDPVVISLEDEAAGNEAILALCRRVLPGWEQLDASQLKLTKISGGISNLLVKVTPPSPLRPVAVKVFGAKTELLIDRAAELQLLLHLNKDGFGAQVLAVFGNGRVEDFMTALTLTPTDMCDPHYVPRIARKLRQLHQVDVSHLGKPQLFETIEGWLAMAKDLDFSHDPAKAELFAKVDLPALGREVGELRALCAVVASPEVMSHNDLLSGNILVLQKDGVDISDTAQVDTRGPLQFIDFEYSAPGFRGFDWGNHFNEYAGFDCDYTRYPGPKEQALFYSHYFASEGSSAPAELGEGELEKLSAEANLYALVSHAYWGIWALIQARYSPIDFNYIEYSALRWSEYHRRKEEFVSAARRVFKIST
mmetsp:Transcript_7572/g.18796  ORF Transcript_7572/g.18796 Transcript_7572/m.18796 type:complete len:369 (-) Transcript_7572:136-1242(-)